MGILVIVVELLIPRLTLAETHLLDVSHQQLHLVVGGHTNAVEEFVGILIVHLHNAHKRKVVVGLRLARMIVAGKRQSLPGIDRCGVEILVVIKV